MKFPIISILIITLAFSGNSYKILTVLSNPGGSHFVIFRCLLRGIVERGHNLTVISYNSSNLPKSDNFREILLSDDVVGRGRSMIDLKDYGSSVKWEAFTSPRRMKKKSFRQCDIVFSNDFIKNLSREENYDLIILEFFSNDCLFLLVDKLEIPVVGVSTTPILPWHNARFGNIENPSYIPNPFFLYSNKMTFLERLLNFLSNDYHKFIFEFQNDINNEILAKKHFNKQIFSLNPQVFQYSSLLLVNSHFSLNFPRPLVPNIVEIGGIHIEDSKKLPENIEKFINESTHGVIYFSLGSMIKGHTFPQEKREEFLKAFARLPQRVLWKWENETMPEKPDNVMIQKWMPQFDILSHPNVKAFISHGGLLGTTEAVHCGVPMLVMPQYGDQHTNAKAIEANGGGVILYLREATEEKVYQSLKTILDPKFREGAKALSERFRDRPMSPMDTAIYWVEYVARHKGAPHMRTAAVDMPLVQYLLLDVIAFLLAVILISVYVTYKISCLILRSLFSKKKVKRS